jgi:hypothetical protein
MWKPQYTGIVPGLVFDVKNNEAVNKSIRIWKNTILILVKILDL